MTNLKGIIKDSEGLQKYCSKVLYAKIGNAQIVSHNCVKTFEEAKTNTNLREPMPYVRKIMTTDKRVVSIHDFQEDTVSIPSFYLSRIVPSSAFSFSDKKFDKETNTRLAITINQPFRFKLRLAAEEEEDKWVELYKFSKDVTEECWVLWDGNIFLVLYNRSSGGKQRLRTQD